MRSVEPGSPNLELARFSNCSMILLEHADRSGGLEITQSGALRRAHVSWAEEAFDWPGYTSDDPSYARRDIRNEYDMFPLQTIHWVLLRTKHARRYKARLRATKRGRELIGVPHRAFNEIMPTFLFGVHHAAQRGWGRETKGHLVDFLDAINFYTSEWILVDELEDHIFGHRSWERDDPEFPLHYGAIRPLVWAGLMLEEGEEFETMRVRKSPLWHEALSLHSDRALEHLAGRN